MDVDLRSEAESALRESEARTRAILRAIPDLMFVQTVDGVYLDYYARNPDDLLAPPEFFLGKSMHDILPPDLAAKFQTVFHCAAESPEPQLLEYSVQLHGEERHFEARMVGAQPGTILSIVREITDRKRAEEALRQSRDRVRVLAGQLITAHEEERVKIANELHDDLSQRLAALAMNLSRLREQLSTVPGAPSSDVAMLERQSADLAERARVLSHELHPAVLEHVGLSAALLSLCSDFSGIQVHLEIGALPSPLPPSVELCLYRVAQETLRNAARHSGAANVFVHLRQTADATELTVRDSGQGFDLDQSRSKGSLGLTSLRERVRLIGGTLQIVSTIGRGTEVHVSAPLTDVTSVTRGQTRRRKA